MVKQIKVDRNVMTGLGIVLVILIYPIIFITIAGLPFWIIILSVLGIIWAIKNLWGKNGR